MRLLYLISHSCYNFIIALHSRYSLFFILRILGEYFSRLFTIEQICERFGISQNQLFKWLALWKAHKREWLGLLSDAETSDSSFLKSLAASDSYSSFSMEFIRLMSHSFLQSHKNPMLTASKNARYHQIIFTPDISIF